MEQRVICGYHPAAIGSNPSRWPRDATIRYRLALPGLPGVSRDALRTVFRAACDWWEAECGLWFDEVESKETFVVTSMTQQPGGVLADCTLPYEFPVRMRIGRVPRQSSIARGTRAVEPQAVCWISRGLLSAGRSPFLAQRRLQR